jgi:hypothetical protein
LPFYSESRIIPDSTWGWSRSTRALDSYPFGKLLVYAGEGVRNQWRAGVAAVDDAARREFDKAFVECGHNQQAAIMRLLAENEAAPETELQRFFAVFKRTAVEGFGLSLVGRRALGYRGNTAIRSFPGCTHREHQPL